jgi:ribonuclease D
MTEPKPPALVDDAVEVGRVLERIGAVGEAAFDFEFLSQDRFTPELCVVQLGWREPGDDQATVCLVDALAVDPEPIMQVLSTVPRLVAHGARQDLGLLALRFDLRFDQVFDTQIAAAFLGMGDQVGYGKLVHALTGLALDKDSQWTDWDRRPLSARQLRYAWSDVAHLPRIHDELERRLGERLTWAMAECRKMSGDAYASARGARDELWRGVGGVRALDAASLPALAALAAWRHRTALESNRPIGWVASDKLLIELARVRPGDEQRLTRVRGAHVLGDLAGEVVAAIKSAEGKSVAGLPMAPTHAPRVALWSEVMLAMVAQAAQDTGIAARFIATRADAEGLARILDGGAALDQARHPLLEGWRRQVVGEAIASWFHGGQALFGDVAAASGVRLGPTTSRPSNT